MLEAEGAKEEEEEEEEQEAHTNLRTERTKHEFGVWLNLAI